MPNEGNDHDVGLREGLSPVEETVLKTIDAYDERGSILVFSEGGEEFLQNLAGKDHPVVVALTNEEKKDELSRAFPSFSFASWRPEAGGLSAPLNRERFKFVASFDGLGEVPSQGRGDLISQIVRDLLQDGGILFVGGRIYASEQEMRASGEEGGALDYEELSKRFPAMVYQPVVPGRGILAIAKGKRLPSPKAPEAIEEKGGEPVQGEERNEKTSTDQARGEVGERKAPSEPNEGGEERVENDVSDAQESAFVEPSSELVAQWHRVRDIPGRTLLELGGNFLVAIRPYEREAADNWPSYGKRLHNLFGGTFTNDDIIDFRITAVRGYFKAEKATLSKDERYNEWIARLFAALFLRQRFPGDKISVNLFGLYFGLVNDLKTIFQLIAEHYDSVPNVVAQIDRLKGSQLADILLTGFNHRRY